MTEPTPVFSRREAQPFQPDGSPRVYTLAPLTYLERQNFRRECTTRGATFPSQAQMLDAIRAALHDLAPDNLAELLAVVDAAQETPDDAGAQASLAAVEAAIGGVPVYAELRAQREYWLGVAPFVAARHALRGWEGEGLPPFVRTRNLVPDALLELLPDDELRAVGWQAIALMQPSETARKNSAPPSPSPEIPETSPAG